MTKPSSNTKKAIKPMKSTKSTKKSNSKQSLTSKFWNLSGITRAVIFGVAFGLIGSSLMVSSHAASKMHTYTYNSPGIRHGTGVPAILGTANIPLSTDLKKTWVWTAYSWSPNDHYMWYGPYVNLSGNHTLRVHWKYYVGRTKSSTVVFDVIYTVPAGAKYEKPGHHVLWSSGNKKVGPDASIDSGSLLIPQPLSADIKLAAHPYPKLEIRVKPISVGTDTPNQPKGSWNNNAFRVESTSWEYL